ncbi:hypothetical protein KGP36_01675 [Patescibacteria group bacterium]|nr:hypothetical protein [Patescibacteria group bacterium]
MSKMKGHRMTKEQFERVWNAVGAHIYKEQEMMTRVSGQLALAWRNQLIQMDLDQHRILWLAKEQARKREKRG